MKFIATQETTQIRQWVMTRIGAWKGIYASVSWVIICSGVFYGSAACDYRHWCYHNVNLTCRDTLNVCRMSVTFSAPVWWRYQHQNNLDNIICNMILALPGFVWTKPWSFVWANNEALYERTISQQMIRRHIWNTNMEYRSTHWKSIEYFTAFTPIQTNLKKLWLIAPFQTVNV